MTGPQTIELESFLTIARTRLQQDQLLAPAGDSARDYLERAAAIDPTAAGVVSLRADLAAATADTARLALDLGNLEQAEMFAAEASSLGADPEVLILLDVDLNAALAARRLERHRESLAVGTARLQQGRLISPPEDSALALLSSIRRDDPEFPGVAAPWQSLLNQVEANTRRLLSAGDWQGAVQWIDALAGTELEPQRVADLRFAARQAQFLATPAPTGTLRVLESVPAVYPEDALRAAIEGWVELDFVVGTDGRTHSITVVDSEPGRRFDEAGIEAVSRQRYEPFEQDGRRYERLLRLRIRFTLD